MRRWWAIVRATMLELSAEPLSLLLTLGAVGTVAITSYLHFHQFGEPSRMARDAGLSAMLVFGLLQAVFCTIKVFRREIESGTLQKALAHPLTRTQFFLAKSAGVAAWCLVTSLVIFSSVVVTVVGAEVGGVIASEESTGLAVVWGPALAADTIIILVPLVSAALANLLWRTRFTLSASLLASLLAVVAAPVLIFWGSSLCGAYYPEAAALIRSSAWRLLAPGAAAFLPLPVFVLASAAASVRLRDNLAATVTMGVLLLAVPFLSNYYLSDALAKGGSLPWCEVALAALAAAPFAVAFAGLGIFLFNDQDVG